ncbi:hypothetical protein EH223_17510 [candidate division KSB1 bacterium]|nr:hypothetical protein [candidate division KSB1 bacterium]RQW00774.1 MAG: hypothetical protein EH223_17510 [candidate division KSB1 bacterium]
MLKNFYLMCAAASLLFIHSTCENVDTAGFDKPTGIYINWAAYDELSDTAKLDESIAMRQLSELIRLRKLGVSIDYYIMDAFWFDKDGGYREWRRESWPNGPDAWLNSCLKNGIKPGVWISTNVLGWGEKWMNPIPSWQTSLNSTGKRLCLFEGGYLSDLFDAMQMWVDRGIAIFKFDFADFYAATPALEDSLAPEEIFRKNVDAFRNALAIFRQKNPDVRILAYNGFGGQYEHTSLPFEKNIDLRWLDVFDAMYCGDPRLADVPVYNFWRSKDIYSDHQVRQYEFNGFPLRRIDNSAFMIGTTGTCYGRRTTAWKGMLLLSLARGGWANTYYGNLDLLTENETRWFARAQQLFLPFQAQQAITTFGAVPGTAEPYGYLAQNKNGAVITLMNPKQAFEHIQLPVTGQTDVVIPLTIEPIQTEFVPDGKNQRTATFEPVADKDIRIIWQQFDTAGLPKRAAANIDGQGNSLGDVLIIRAEQNGAGVPVQINYDKTIWSGLSWAVGEMHAENIDPHAKLRVHCYSKEPTDITMECRIYSIQYE